MATILEVKKTSETWEGMPVWSVSIGLKCRGQLDFGATFLVPAWTKKQAVNDALMHHWYPNYGHM